MTRRRKNPSVSEIRTRDLPLWRRTPDHLGNEAVLVWGLGESVMVTGGLCEHRPSVAHMVKPDFSSFHSYHICLVFMLLLLLFWMLLLLLLFFWGVLFVCFCLFLVLFC